MTLLSLNKVIVIVSLHGEVYQSVVWFPSLLVECLSTVCLSVCCEPFCGKKKIGYFCLDEFL